MQFNKLVIKQSEHHRRCPKQPEQGAVVVFMEWRDGPEICPDPHAHIFWYKLYLIYPVNKADAGRSRAVWF